MGTPLCRSCQHEGPALLLCMIPVARPVHGERSECCVLVSWIRHHEDSAILVRREGGRHASHGDGM